jgi:drug/metabolite transporter (DMT)-like permease
MSPYVKIIIAAILAGSSGAFIKYLDLPSTTLTFFRMAIPTLLLLGLFALQKKQVIRNCSPLMLVASLLNAARLFFYFIGYSYTSIANAVIMLYTWPIFTTLLSMLLFREKVANRNMMLMCTSFSGIVIIYLNQNFSLDNKDMIGISSMLLSAFLYAVSVLIFKKESNRYTAKESVFYQNMLGVVIYAPFILTNRPGPTISEVGIMTCYAVLIGLIVFILFFSALKQIKASTASLLFYMEIVSALFCGIFLFDERLSWNLITGGAIIILSTILLKKEPASTNDKK